MIDMLTEGKAKPDAWPGANLVLLSVPAGVPEQWASMIPADEFPTRICTALRHLRNVSRRIDATLTQR